jgi:acetolactate synthase-1/2/3 large subunit
MASVEQDLTAALRSLAEASGAADAAAPRQPRTEAAATSGDLTAEAIGQSVCMLMPDNAILVDEAATNGTLIFAATKGARAHAVRKPPGKELNASLKHSNAKIAAAQSLAMASVS